jgi:hypothetical protein
MPLQYSPVNQNLEKYQGTAEQAAEKLLGMSC